MNNPVLIVGAGPTGLTLALTLCRYGVPVRIIDARPTAHHQSRALAIHSRTLEVFEDFNIVDEALDRGSKVSVINLHFNKKKQVSFDFSLLKAPYPFILILPQYETEHLLIHKLHEYDVKVERNVKLVGLKTEADHVWVTLASEVEQKETTKMSWVVGCDGGHSRLRSYLGGEFKGYDYPQSFSLADVEMKTDLAPGEMHSFLSKEGAQFIIPIKGPLYRIINQLTYQGFHKPTTLQGLETLLAERSMGNCKIQEVEWIQDFNIHNRLSSVYRRGRLFIAGDAAHIHSPAGGQGMNMGIQDAYNLGWKLAYVFNRHSSTKLLASYSRERVPIAKQILFGTEKLTRIMTANKTFSINYYARLIRAVQSIPLFHKMIIYQFSGLANSYKKSPIIQSQKRWFGMFSAVKAGHRFSDTILKSAEDRAEMRSHQLVQGIDHHLLIFFKDTKYSQAIALKEEAECRFKAFLKIHLVCTSAEIEQNDCWIDENLQSSSPYRLGNNFLVIVRPDKYIGMTKKGLKKEAVEEYFQELLHSSLYRSELLSAQSKTERE